MRRTSFAGIIDEDSGMLVGGKQAANLFAQYFDQLLNSPPPDAQRLDVWYRPRYDCDTNLPSIFEVRDAINGMRLFSAPGADGVWPVYLQCMPLGALRKLIQLYEEIWRSGIIPDDWSMASIAPLHKKGDKSDKANYRGISLLQTLYKVLERVIF